MKSFMEDEKSLRQSNLSKSNKDNLEEDDGNKSKYSSEEKHLIKENLQNGKKL
jgi:hypothetical protein